MGPTLKSIVREARRKEKKQAAKEKQQAAEAANPPHHGFGVDPLAHHFGGIPMICGHTAPTAHRYYTLTNRSNEVTDLFVLENGDLKELEAK
jgi:hypothetical protein